MKSILKIVSLAFMVVVSMPLMAQIDDDVEVQQTPSEEEIRLSAVQTSPIGLGKYRLGDGITLLSKTDSYNINLSGYIQSTLEMTRYSDVEPDFAPVWDKTYLRWRLRRARIRLGGEAWGGKVRYRITFDAVKGSDGNGESAGASMLQDAYIQWRPYNSNKLVLSFGQRYTPTDNKELYMSSLSSEFVERSKLTSAFATVREVGLFVESSFKIGNSQFIRPSFALTDGSGSISTATRYGGVKVGGRINYLPLGSFRLYGDTRFGDFAYELKPKIAIGVAYSYSSRTADRRGGDGGGPYAYKKADGENSLSANDMIFPNYSKLSADIMVKYRGFSLFGEYIKSWASVPKDIAYRVVFGATNGNNISNSFNQPADMNGAAGDINAYVRNRMILGSGCNVQGSYMFRSLWNVALRYTHISPDEYSYLNNRASYDRNDWYAASVTKWLTNSYATKIQLTYSTTKPDNGFGRIVQSDNNVAKFSGWEHHVWLMFQLAF